MVEHRHPEHSPPLVPNTGVMLARNSTFCRDLFALALDNGTVSRPCLVGKMQR
jgi:hypothetical protein